MHPVQHPPHPEQQPPPRPIRWSRFAAWTVAAAVAAFAVGGLIASQAGNGGASVASPPACKKALAANFQKAMTDPDASPAPEPAACVGLDEATLERIGGEVMAEYTASPEAEKAFEDQWRKAWESATATP